MIKAIPIPNLKIKEAEASIFEKKLLSFVFKFCILSFVSHIYYSEL
jgi:hypothetical protein